MNINSVNTAPASMESPPLEPPMPTSTPTKPAFSPNRVDAPGKLDSQLSDPNQKAAKLKDEEKEDKSNFSVKEAKQLAEDMNEIMDDLQTSLGFSIKEELNNQVVVEITDRKTNEVIKQIPTEEMLTIKEKMEALSGLLFDQKV